MEEDKKNTRKGFQMYNATAHNIYAQNNVAVESPAKLIEMLYEGVLRFNAQAKRSIEDGNIEKKVYWINRSTAVIAELIAVLDMNAGAVSAYLNGLYTREIQLLVEANIENNTQKVDECSNVFKTLLEAWRETTNVD